MPKDARGKARCRSCKKLRSHHSSGTFRCLRWNRKLCKYVELKSVFNVKKED